MRDSVRNRVNRGVIAAGKEWSRGISEEENGEGKRKMEAYGEKIRELALGQQDYAVRMRREFHRYPEVSGEEWKTRGRLIAEIEKMGLPYEKVPGTGLIAVIQGKKPGKSRVLRADMDGLPLKEERDRRSLSCLRPRRSYGGASGDHEGALPDAGGAFRHGLLLF